MFVSLKFRSFRMNIRRKSRVVVMALNKLTSTPSSSVTAKPCTKLDVKKYKIDGSDDGRSVRIADRRPCAAETFLDRRMRAGRPRFNSSLIRSKIRILASTAMPIVRMKPARPASESVMPTNLKRPSESAI